MATTAAVVLAFSASDAGDLGQIEYLASELADVEIVAVAQALDPREQAALATRFAPYGNVSIAQLGVPIGRGAAIRAGLSRVATDLVAIVNLDEFIDPETVAAAIRRLDAHDRLDAVLATRTLRHGRLRNVLSRGYNACANTCFALGTRDVQAPIKVFRRRALDAIVDRLQLRSRVFDVDLLVNARRAGLRIAEVAIENAPRHRLPMLRTAVDAMVSLAVLRVLYTPIGRHPIVMRLGRPYLVSQKRSLSVLIFCWRDPRSPRAGGGEVYLHKQARQWVAQGHRVTWIAQGFSGGASEETFDGIRIVRVGRGLTVFPAAMLWYLMKSGWRFDFILDVMNGVPFFTPLFSGKPKACLVYHLHAKHFCDELPRPLSDLAVAVETRLVPWIYRRTRFLTISESSARELARATITRLPIEVIHSGVDDELTSGERHARPTILYLGRLRRYKGVRKLIDAFAVVRETIGDARLVIAGTGDDEFALRAYARATPGIEFVGHVNEAQKRRLFQEAWVLGMPSTIEGWGIVVIEAARCGTPSVAYDVNGLRDCIRDGETGYLAADDAAFAARLGQLLKPGPHAAAFREACLTWSRTFSWNRCAARTLEQVRSAQLWSVAVEPQMVVLARPKTAAVRLVRGESERAM